MVYPPVRPAIVLLLFAAIAFLSGASQVALGAWRGNAPSAGATFAHSGFVWLLFGALSFVAIYAARRFPIERQGLNRAVPAHLLAFITVSATHTVLYTLFLRSVLRRDGPTDPLLASVIGNLRGDVFLYGLIVGAYYLYAYTVTSRDRDKIADVLKARAADLESSLSAVLAQPAASAGYLTRIPLKDDGRVEFISTDTLERIEADGDYVRLHAGGTPRLLRQSLTSLEKQLDPRQFVRVHRSTIVSLARIGELQPLFHGEFVAVMTSGARVRVSRTHRGALMEALGVSA